MKHANIYSDSSRFDIFIVDSLEDYFLGHYVPVSYCGYLHVGLLQ